MRIVCAYGSPVNSRAPVPMSLLRTLSRFAAARESRKQAVAYNAFPCSRHLPSNSKQETAQMRTAYALLAAIALFPLSVFAAAPGELRTMAHSAYEWYDEAYPVAASSLGDHRFHARLTDYRMSEVVRRRQHVSDLLAQVRELATDGWSKDDRIDRVLFESQLASMDFFGRRLNPEGSNPQLYVDECSNSIFTLLQKEYAPRRTRALAAISRLEQMPALLEVARTNLTEPVKLYASLAIESARGGDDLYSVSLMTLAEGLSRAESARLVKARDGAVKALHDFADWLETGLPKMPDWRPMGEASYNYLLKRVLLLPLDAHDVAQLGEIELARYRALEAMLKDPSLASPDPARAKHIPKDEAEFLAAYESRLKEIVEFLRANRLVTIPDYMGPFQMRQLPEAFKPTSPGGFMNPPASTTRIPAASTTSRRITPRAATSTSARPSRIRVRSWATRAFPGTSCRYRSRITYRARSGACRATASSRKAGRSTEKRC